MKFRLFIIIGLILTSGFAWAERLAVISPTANIRLEPNTESQVIWQVEKYYPLEIIKKKGAWYLFKDFEGDMGWIHESLVGKINTVITQKDTCNIRSGPGTENKIVFSTGKGVPFKVIGNQQNWFHVEHGDGEKGWIYKSLVW